MSYNGTRNETKCRKTRSRDGSISPKLNVKISERITRYCELKNINRTKFVEQCCETTLDRLEQSLYEGMSKDELIVLLMSMQK